MTVKSNVVVLLMTFVCYLVTETDSQLVNCNRMRTISSEENLQLDWLINMETGRLELGFTLDYRQEGDVKSGNVFKHTTIIV